MLVKVLNRNVLAHVHITEQANIAALQNLVQRHNDLLNARVIWRHTVANKTVGGRKLLEQINCHVQTGLRQNVGRVNTRRAGSNNSNI